MRYLIISFALSALTTTGCSPSWPKSSFPKEAEVTRILFSDGSYGLREGCVAVVAELSEDAASRLINVKMSRGVMELVPPAGWTKSPMTSNSKSSSFYSGAFNGCNERQKPLGDLPGALQRPGAFYKVINGGEGIAIIVPRSKLAGYFYFG